MQTAFPFADRTTQSADRATQSAECAAPSAECAFSPSCLQTGQRRLQTASLRALSLQTKPAPCANAGIKLHDNRAVTSKRNDAIAFALLDIFTVYGAPAILQSDNGREFTQVTNPNPNPDDPDH